MTQKIFVRALVLFPVSGDSVIYDIPKGLVPEVKVGSVVLVSSSDYMEFKAGVIRYIYQYHYRPGDQHFIVDVVNTEHYSKAVEGAKACNKEALKMKLTILKSRYKEEYERALRDQEELFKSNQKLKELDRHIAQLEKQINV